MTALAFTLTASISFIVGWVLGRASLIKQAARVGKIVDRVMQWKIES